MKSRSKTTIILALVLILIVMCAAVFVTYANLTQSEKYSSNLNWQISYRGAESMKIIDLTGDGQKDVFVQNPNNVTILNQLGGLFFQEDYPSPLTTTMGDVNGDGVEDVVVFSPTSVSVLSNGSEIMKADVLDLNIPARAAVVRFQNGSQIILGDTDGNLLSLSPTGQELWLTKLSPSYPIRGLDTALLNGQVYLAAAHEGGSVALYDDHGQARWNYNLGVNLRRLRAYDLNGDGNSEIILGGESGRLVILNADTGNETFFTSLGQRVTEIRAGELDGNPSSMEFVVGGKNGGVWAFQADGSRIWSKTVSEKVTEIAFVDLQGEGANAVIIGDDSGNLTVFSGKSGNRFPLKTYSSGIARIDVGKLTESRQLLVASGQEVQLLNLKYQSLGFIRYLPILAGLLISVLIVIVAWFIATNPPKPVLKTAVEDQSIEGLQAERRMLHENIADVERLKVLGEMTPEAYLARLKELRGQLANNETALRKAGVPITPETFKCPYCGGTLPLGTDKCDYCGQTVIT